MKMLYNVLFKFVLENIVFRIIRELRVPFCKQILAMLIVSKICLAECMVSKVKTSFLVLRVFGGWTHNLSTKSLEKIKINANTSQKLNSCDMSPVWVTQRRLLGGRERKDNEEYTVVHSTNWHKSLGHRTQHVHQFKEQSMTGVPETGQYSLL